MDLYFNGGIRDPREGGNSLKMDSVVLLYMNSETLKQDILLY